MSNPFLRKSNRIQPAPQNNRFNFDDIKSDDSSPPLNNRFNLNDISQNENPPQPNNRFKLDDNSSEKNNVPKTDIPKTSRWGGIQNDIEFEEERKREFENNTNRFMKRHDHGSNSDGIVEEGRFRNKTLSISLGEICEGERKIYKTKKKQSYFGFKKKTKVESPKQFDLAKEEEDFPELG